MRRSEELSGTTDFKSRLRRMNCESENTKNAEFDLPINVSSFGVPHERRRERVCTSIRPPFAPRQLRRAGCSLVRSRDSPNAPRCVRRERDTP